MPRGLIEDVRALAVKHDRTLAAELRVALRDYIDAHEEDAHHAR